ncbi:MAG: hypothetical protein PWP71_1472 [Clostridia bacterium]|nr:hypothetical protein [Clostridia bacterium]
MTWHFTQDNKITLVEGEPTLAWYYQNYYLSKKYSFDVHLFSVEDERVDRIEALAIGMFLLDYGAAPLCNSKIDRGSFPSLYYSSSEEDKSLIHKIFEQIEDENVAYTTYEKVKPVKSKSSNNNPVSKKGSEGMHLSFEQKKQIFRSFPELTEETISNGRVNYKFLGSRRPGKIIARELSHTGNGYVYGGFLEEYKHVADSRGWVNIKNYSETELRQIIERVLSSFK